MGYANPPPLPEEHLSLAGLDLPMKTAICCCTDRNFLPAACILLKRITEKSPDLVDTDYFLFVDETVSNDDIAAASVFLAVHDCHPTFMRDDLSLLDVYDTRPQPTRAGFIRLHYHELLGPDFDRALHIDADMRPETSFAPLLSTDMDSQPIAAVEDIALYAQLRVHDERRLAGVCPEGRYFNSGLFLIDLRHPELADRMAHAQSLLRNPEVISVFGDQTPLNAAFDNAWKSLDPRWNINDYLYRLGIEPEPFLMHFTSTKPWSAERSIDLDPFAEWYRAETANSQWRAFVRPRINHIDLRKLWLQQIRNNAWRYRLAALVPWSESRPTLKRDYLLWSGQLKRMYEQLRSDAQASKASEPDPQRMFM